MPRHAMMASTFRRLLSPASASKLTSLTSTTAALRVSASHGTRASRPLICNSCQKRSYAAPPAPKPAKSAAELFDLSCSFETFAALVEVAEFSTFSAEQYYDCLMKSAEAIKAGNSPWHVRLPGVSAQMMHETGCILRHARTVRNANSFCYSMWASASAMGHKPATLSLSLWLIRSGAWGKQAGLRSVETQFKKIVSEGRDPNALTAEGELLYRNGKFDGAARTLRRAFDVGGPSFEWKPYCEHLLGLALLKLGRTTEAKDHLTAAVESGCVDAEGDYGQMIASSDPEKAEPHLFFAANLGKPHLFSVLSEIELRRQFEATDEKARREHALWAKEWSKLASQKADKPTKAL